MVGTIIIAIGDTTIGDGIDGTVGTDGIVTIGNEYHWLTVFAGIGEFVCNLGI